MNEKKICAYCGEEYDADDMTLINDEWVCDDCRDERFFLCDHCDEWHDIDFMYSINDGREYWCESCTADYAQQCDDCGNWYTPMYIWADDGDRVICDDCSDSWRVCDDCGTILHEDDAYSDGYEWYCHSCYIDRVDDDDYIHDHDYKPDPEIRFRKGETGNELTFGVELEVDDGDCAGDTAEEVYDAGEGRVYCKSDGSLNCGFEIVSHPGSLAHHMYEMHWSNISRICRKAGFNSHDTSTCGLHIHVGRKQLGNTLEEREDAIANAIVLVTSLREDIVPFTRRTDYNLNRWASLPNIDLTLPTSDLRFEALHYQDDLTRYQAVNLRNYSTIEFRIFRGTLNRDTLMASLQLVSNLCKFAMAHTLEECTTATFADIVAVAPYKELVSYCTTRGIRHGVEIPA